MVEAHRRSVAGVALVCAAAGACPAAAADDVAALRAYRPELRYDRSERHFPTSVASWLRRHRGSSEPVVYGRSVRRRDGRWLQYWIFYAFNPQDRGLVRTGRHEGDWELVQVRLDPRGLPERAVFRAHTWAQRCDWDEVVRSRSGAPVVFVANSSHARLHHPGRAAEPARARVPARLVGPGHARARSSRLHGRPAGPRLADTARHRGSRPHRRRRPGSPAPPPVRGSVVIRMPGAVVRSTVGTAHREEEPCRRSIS